MELTTENILEFTEYMCREYYHQNLQPILSVISKDISWIDPGKIFLFGREAFERQFKAVQMHPMIDLDDIDFHLLPFGKDAYIVIARYYAYTSAEAEYITAAMQRATFYYRMNKGRLELVHMHVSNEWQELIGDEVFPVHISTQTYQYVKKILAERLERRDEKKLSLKGGTANFYIDPSKVLYIETVGAKSVIHLFDQNITVNYKIGVLEGMFPDYFYRAHRSYLINTEYSIAIERYYITMSNGQLIPIPEKRYNEVKKTLAKKIGL